MRKRAVRETVVPAVLAPRPLTPPAAWECGMFYRIFRLLARIYLSRVRLSVEGLENIPSHGPAVIAGNHPSAVDQLIVMISLVRDYCCLQRAENFRNGLAGWWLRRTCALPVVPGADNSHSFERIEGWMRQGSLYLTAPEGDVSPEGAVGPFRGGFVSLAVRMGAPVIPLAILGSHLVLREPRRPRGLGDFLPRPARVRLAFLAPMLFQGHPRTEEETQRRADSVRQVIIEKLVAWQS